MTDETLLGTRTADDLFEALVGVRLALEGQGWMLAVQGARRHAYPSRMSRQFGGEVYLLETGQRPEQHVHAFEDAPEDVLATVAEQREAFESWVESTR